MFGVKVRLTCSMILSRNISRMSKKTPGTFSRNKYYRELIGKHGFYNICIRNTHTQGETESDRKEKTVSTLFETGKREKASFLDVIYTYQSDQRKFGHVKFVYTALRYMDKFGVNEDLEIYKAILNVLPKGRYVAQTLLQNEFMHYPREQQCVTDLLEKMENNGVIPDPEMELMVINITGQHSYPLRKLRRMNYWQNKFKYLNPWLLPRPLTTDSLELAKLAIQRICSVDVASTITVFNSKDLTDAIDETWIVSGSSPDQEKLISKHPKDKACYVEGPFRIWLSKNSVDYFILKSDPIPPPQDDTEIDDVSKLNINLWKRAEKKLALFRSIHEQDHLTVLGVCATGTSSKDSLLSWIRFLQRRNPALESIPILFKFIRSVDTIEQIESGEENSVKDENDGENNNKSNDKNNNTSEKKH